METITNWLAAVYAWFANFWDWIESAVKWIFDGLILLLQFVTFTLLDGLLIVVESLLAAIDLSAVAFNYAAAWADLPTQLVWFINALGLPQCFSMLGAAYLIRLTLNLIPSWATRV